MLPVWLAMAAAACSSFDALPRALSWTWPMVVLSWVLVRLRRMADGRNGLLGALELSQVLCCVCLLHLSTKSLHQAILSLCVVDHLLHDVWRQARLCRRGKDLRLGALVDASLQGEPIGHGAQLLDRQRIVIVGHVGLRDRS